MEKIELASSPNIRPERNSKGRELLPVLMSNDGQLPEKPGALVGTKPRRELKFSNDKREWKSRPGPDPKSDAVSNIDDAIISGGIGLVSAGTIFISPLLGVVLPTFFLGIMAGRLYKAASELSGVGLETVAGFATASTVVLIGTLTLLFGIPLITVGIGGITAVAGLCVGLKDKGVFNFIKRNKR